jgi:hypothetical protein
MKDFLKKYWWAIAAGVVVVAVAVVLIVTGSRKDVADGEETGPREIPTLFGIPYENYEVVEG